MGFQRGEPELRDFLVPGGIWQVFIAVEGGIDGVLAGFAEVECLRAGAQGFD
jgi:hypothetical protein